jgi:hypothetical protein
MYACVVNHQHGETPTVLQRGPIGKRLAEESLQSFDSWRDSNAKYIDLETCSADSNCEHPHHRVRLLFQS